MKMADETEKLIEAHWEFLENWFHLMFHDSWVHGVKHERESLNTATNPTPLSSVEALHVLIDAVHRENPDAKKVRITFHPETEFDLAREKMRDDAVRMKDYVLKNHPNGMAGHQEWWDLLIECKASTTEVERLEKAGVK